MNDHKPVVSICTQTYNHKPYIQQCLDGLLMQKCSFLFEVLIHDDASTDGTSEIIREYQAKYPNIIKPIIQIENQWSKGIKGNNRRFNFPRAKGKYIAMCEGDDYWTDPLKLQKQVDFLEANPEYSYCFHGWVILKEGNSLPDPEIQKGDRTLTLMFRTESIKDFKPNTEALNGDLILKFHLRTKGKSKYLSHIKPAVYRHHSSGAWSMIGELNRKKQRIITWSYLFETYKNTEYSIGIKSVLISLNIDNCLFLIKNGLFYEKVISVFNLFYWGFKKVFLLVIHKKARKSYYLPLLNPHPSNPKEFKW